MLSQILLQVQTVTQTGVDTLQAAANAAPQQAPPTELSFWFLIKEGGPLMIPLAICSIVALYIFIERLIAISRLSGSKEDVSIHLRPMIKKGDFDNAKHYCQRVNNSVSRMLEKGIARIGKPYEVIENSMESVAEREIYKMESGVGILATIADIAPMFGFLGTIAGMIQLFYNVNTHGFSLESISSGIYTKMITSAVGLIIGILAYMGYKFLNRRIDQNINRMEIQASDFMDCLYEPIQS